MKKLIPCILLTVIIGLSFGFTPSSTVTQTTYTVSGSVVDQHGNTVALADIKSSCGAKALSFSTGGFAITVSQRSVTLTASKNGYDSGSASASGGSSSASIKITKQ